MLEKLVNFSLDRLSIRSNEQPVIALMSWVIEKQCYLVTQWQRVGFIHGVMNTDNTTISGDTIDFGPCAFLGAYNSQACFSSIDQSRRYAYQNQPKIVQWNLVRLAESLCPLIEQDKSLVQSLENKIENMSSGMAKMLDTMYANKMGFTKSCEKTKQLSLYQWLMWLEKNKFDYSLGYQLLNESLNEVNERQTLLPEDFLTSWKSLLKQKYISSEQASLLMKQNNPINVPRNKDIEEVIEKSIITDSAKPIEAYLQFLMSSELYLDEDKMAAYHKFDRYYETFVGLEGKEIFFSAYCYSI